MYTPDAVVLPPGSEMVKGRSAIQAFWKKSAEQIGDIKLTTLDVKPLGKNAAREIGTFTLKTKATPPQDVAGKYVVVRHKAGRAWKLGADIWNADK
jgi:ketosteroid isomerase-like protein